MAYSVEVTLGTGNKVSLNDEAQEVSVSITYRLEQEDTDVLVLVEEKAEELVAAHALAWKQVKQDSWPTVIDKTEEVEINDSKTDVQEDIVQSENESTAAQTQLIYSLSQQAGLREDDLENRLQTAYGCHLPEELSHSQAARLIVEIGREERERFEQERERTQQRDGPANKTPYNSP